MTQSTIYISLVLLGLVLGSFAGALVWRLRSRQLSEDKEDGIEVNDAEYKRLHPLSKTSLLEDYSRCLSCSHRLRWYDMVPIISWIALRGRCRRCHTRIGWLEPLTEISLAVFFVSSYAFWPYPLESTLEIARLIIWLIAGTGLLVLFIYDLKWLLLPDKVNFVVIGLGIINASIVIFMAQDILSALMNIGVAVLILSGLYLMLNLSSRGKWVGLGDVKLGLGLALLLADWRLAFVAFFAANLVGTLAVIPAMITGKVKRDSHIPLGPLLIAGWVIAGLAGQYLIDTYLFALV